MTRGVAGGGATTPGGVGGASSSTCLVRNRFRASTDVAHARIAKTQKVVSVCRVIEASPVV